MELVYKVNSPVTAQEVAELLRVPELKGQLTNWNGSSG